MKISIIVPVYNVEQYILECLRSVANQTMTDGIECILVDDCGHDNSVQIAEKFIKEYSGRIKFSFIHRRKNGGLSAARNTGICAAKGEYLYFLDSDDEITPNCIELMYSHVIRHPKVILVQGSFYENDNEFSLFSDFPFPEYSEDLKQIKSYLLTYSGDIVGAQSRLIRTDFIKTHNLFFKEGIIHEDNYWTYFLAKKVTSMAFEGVRTYYHRYNPTSITGNVNVEKEAIAYRTIIEDFCVNIDSFLRGRQKELILNTLLTPVKNQYFDAVESKQIIACFAKQNNILEKFLFLFYLSLGDGYFKTKVLHLLLRLYKILD